MRKTKNYDLLKEAYDLVNELEYVGYKAPLILKQLQETKFTQTEIEQMNIQYLIDAPRKHLNE